MYQLQLVLIMLIVTISAQWFCDEKCQPACVIPVAEDSFCCALLSIWGPKKRIKNKPDRNLKLISEIRSA